MDVEINFDPSSKAHIQGANLARVLVALRLTTPDIRDLTRLTGDFLSQEMVNVDPAYSMSVLAHAVVHAAALVTAGFHLLERESISSMTSQTAWTIVSEAAWNVAFHSDE